MNKILLIIEREVLNRVGKKSFLVATILIPLIFPAIIALLFCGISLVIAFTYDTSL